MNISFKFHSILSYLSYFFNSKSKYKIHSPFVFNFIKQILESNIENTNTTKLINFYKKQYKFINYCNNIGAGSSVLNKINEPTKSYIKKVGIPKKYGKVLMQLAKQFQNKTILELGTSLGVSTSYLLSSNNNIISIEGNKDIFLLTNNAFKHLNFNNVSLINDDFDHALENILIHNNNITMFFIDGNHTKKATLKYFNTILPYIKEDSIIVLDDIYWNKEMFEAWHEIRANNKVKLSIDLYRIGILFFRQEQKEQEHFTLWY